MCSCFKINIQIRETYIGNERRRRITNSRHKRDESFRSTYPYIVVWFYCECIEAPYRVQHIYIKYAILFSLGLYSAV